MSDTASTASTTTAAAATTSAAHARPSGKLRTMTEIRVQALKSDGFFAFDREVYVGYLDFEHAQPLLREGAKAEDWRPDPLTREQVLADMSKYMDFAWGKVEDHRGLSAGRSVQKMSAWLWILGDEETHALLETTSYAQYGAPILKLICERYGLPIPESEALARMSRGEPCRFGCDMGCGTE